MSETDKLKVEMYDDVVKEKNKEYIELTCRFRETCNDIKNKDKEIERLQKIIFSAMHYVDQVLGYHLNSGYEQLDKDCNELFGILKGDDKE